MTGRWSETVAETKACGQCGQRKLLTRTQSDRGVAFAIQQYCDACGAVGPWEPLYPHLKRGEWA
jgi:hypothetical protein